MSGLPFFDVMVLPGLPKSASLPVGTVQETKRRILNGTWDFDYVFFTESDQILMMRVPEVIYSYLDKHPRHLMIPHRLMAYPSPILKLHHKRPPSSGGPFDWMDLSCCLPRQNCVERKEWVHVSNTSLPVLNIYGIQVPLGNSNFHAESYRGCVLRNGTGPNFSCP